MKAAFFSLLLLFAPSSCVLGDHMFYDLIVVNMSDRALELVDKPTRKAVTIAKHSQYVLVNGTSIIDNDVWLGAYELRSGGKVLEEWKNAPSSDSIFPYRDHAVVVVIGPDGKVSDR